jgi:DNA-binding winged helix-turn-helix (wHTH) protein
VQAAARFGEFWFDPGRRELRRGDEVVPLAPKAFELLALLLERRPEAVSKTEIRERVWPRTVVSDASLPRLVNAIRAALGDDSDRPRFVRTVHGFGYAFCGEVEGRQEPLLAPAARLVWGGRQLALHEGRNVIGRDADTDVCIDAATVSRRHARITIDPEGATIEDLDSKNGTGVGAEGVRGPRRLVHGDEIRLGEVWVSFEQPPSTAASTRTASGRRRGR